MPCIGIKASGEVCNKKCLGDQPRCGIHTKTRRDKGPNQCAIVELGYIHKKQKSESYLRYSHNHAVPGADLLRIREDYEIETQQMKLDQNRERTELVRRHRELIDQTGVDPDQEARDAMAARAIAEAQARANLRAARIAQMAEWGIGGAGQMGVLEHIAPVPVPVPVGERALGAFARDPQNVHTTQAVLMVKAIVQKVLEVPVPEDYKWNELLCSKTPGEIIMLCKLTPGAAWQMGAKYCSAETIYDLEKGIYGKVLDSVWQFILKSEHKDDLCRILKGELQDNVGMCAQGNLSRLANILAGYLDGVGSQESLSEKLGRLIPALMDIDDVEVRGSKLAEILNENRVPKAEWLDWAEPLFDGYNLRITEDNILMITEV
jgi:hypothetical protein